MQNSIRFILQYQDFLKVDVIYPFTPKSKRLGKQWCQRLVAIALASGLLQAPAAAIDQIRVTKQATSLTNTASYSYTDATGIVVSGTTNQPMVARLPPLRGNCWMNRAIDRTATAW